MSLFLKRLSYAPLFLFCTSSPLQAFPYLYVAQSDGSCSVFNIVNSTNPSYRNSVPNLQAFALSLISNGKYLDGSTASYTSLPYWDFINPAQPVFVQNGPGTNHPWGVLVPPDNPNYFVTGGGVSVFSVYSMFDPANMGANTLAPLQSSDFFGMLSSIPYLYIVQNGALQTFDVTDSSNPILQSSISINSNHLVLHPTGSNLYVVDSTNLQLAVFDLSSPSSPAALPMDLPTGTNPQVATIIPSGNYLYLVNQGDNSLSIFNIQTPSAPVAVSPFISSNLSLPYSLISSPDGLALYVTNQGDSSISVLDISSPESPVWVENLPVSQVPTYMTISAPFLYPFSKTMP